MNNLTLEGLFDKYPDKEFGEVNVHRKFTFIDYTSHKLVKDFGWEIYLEHSCDEWVIGDVIKAEIMQGDLRAAIEYCKANP